MRLIHHVIAGPQTQQGNRIWDFVEDDFLQP